MIKLVISSTSQQGRRCLIDVQFSLSCCDVDVKTLGNDTIDRHASTNNHRRDDQSACASSLSLFFCEAALPQDDKNCAANTDIQEISCDRKA